MEKFLAGIIVYSPDKSILNLINALIEQKVEVLLFINKSDSFIDEIIKKKNLNTISLGFNAGVSVGLNYIIKKFLNSNYEFLFTFDQDSMIDDNYVRIMVDNYKNALKIDKNVVCLSPKIIDEKFDKEELIKINYSKSRNVSKFKNVKFSITSGSLFIKNSFLKVGLMNDHLFIDGVDTDWCERAVLKKQKLLKSNNVFLKHKIGNKFINVFGIKKSYHQLDLRVYYIVRNSIYLILYGENRIYWKIVELQRTIVRTLAYPLLSLNKFKTLLIIILAIKDGFKKDMGKMKYINH
tara:strand:- start:988 stop:1869 length:882 start_codon:yes stop_codon:yes gene_type:complete